MDWLWQLITNPFLLTGTLSWFIAQLAKTIIHAIIHKKIDWERLIGDGGMPSGHSATVTSMAAMALLSFGPGSFEFALACILAIIVCHDAMGVRREAGKQAILLNEILRCIDELIRDDITDVKLKEFVGHTPIQVLAGILIGIVTSLFMHFVIFS